MKRWLLILGILIFVRASLWAQMPPANELIDIAQKELQADNLCQAQYHLLWAALSPELKHSEFLTIDSLLHKDQMVAFSKETHDAWEPQFPGGDSALAQFIVNNLKLPRDTSQYFNQVIVVKIEVERDGQIVNAKIQKGFTDEDNEACLEMVKKMPYWRPGAMNCRPCRCHFNLPISLNLERYNIFLE